MRASLQIRREARMKHLLVIFVTVFLAELGDKTQLATLLFTAERQQHPFLIFLAAAFALIAATAIAVLLGTMAERYLSMIPLKLIAGLGFVAIGIWTLWDHFSVA
jgi:putative Ca2+/H+ antiporter (TMEM165/GDT1 family)